MKSINFWIYLFFGGFICFTSLVETQKNIKNFNISVINNTLVEKLSEKCFAICNNNATSTIVVQIATDNVTKINIPVYHDIMAIVYYKCTNQITKDGPGKYEYHTFQKLCGNVHEKCKKLKNGFDKQWFSLKTGEIPKIYVNFSLPMDAENIKIKIQSCVEEQIVFPFKVQNKSIDYREQFQKYNYSNHTFTSQDLEKMPISLSIHKFKVEVLADIEFNVRKIDLEKCSSINQKYCANLCSNGRFKSGTKCYLKVKDKEIILENRNTNCLNKDRNPQINITKTTGFCAFYESKNNTACKSICIDLPNCSYMCLLQGSYELEEFGYRDNVLKVHFGRVGSGQWSYENIPTELVSVNECEFSPRLCLDNRICVDEPVGYRCSNNEFNTKECLKIRKNRFWSCPASNNNNSSTSRSNEFVRIKVNEIISNLENEIKLLNSTEKIFTFMTGLKKFTIEAENFSQKVNETEKETGLKFLIKNIERVVEQTLDMELNKDKTSVTKFSDEYDAYGSYINETEVEHDIPLTENKTNSELQFVKLKIKDSSNAQGNKKLITTFIRFKQTDILGESAKARSKIENSSELKLNDNELVKRYKNSDFISLFLNQKRNVTVHFKLPTFVNEVQSKSWLYSFEEECGYLDEDKPWEWSISGCRKIMNSGNDFYCECDHLSNFAMLFSVKTVNEIHLVIFKYLSIIGGITNILSLFFFLIFVLLINSRDKLRLDQLNIAICLLIGTFVFLLGGVTTFNQIFCKLSAIFTQFLFLSAFVWKLILGINVVRMIASLRYQNEDWMVKYRVAAFAVGYGVPLVIVVISGSIYWNSYGAISDDVCWIDNNSKAFLTFIIPIGIILAINLIALLFIANALIRNYLDTRKTKVNESNEMMVFMQLFASMGLTWLPSYFATVYLVAIYMWVIFFPFQGLMMFLFVVVINRENREKVSSFVLEKYSTLISKSTSSSDTRSHSKSKSTTNSKVTEQNQSLLSETEKEKNVAFQMVTISNHDDVTIPLKNPVC